MYKRSTSRRTSRASFVWYKCHWPVWNHQLHKHPGSVTSYSERSHTTTSAPRPSFPRRYPCENKGKKNSHQCWHVARVQSSMRLQRDRTDREETKRFGFAETHEGRDACDACHMRKPVQHWHEPVARCDGNDGKVISYVWCKFIVLNSFLYIQFWCMELRDGRYS